MKKLIYVLLILTCLIQPVSAQLMDSPWPMFGMNLNHTSQSLYESNSDGTIKWTYNTEWSNDIDTSSIIDSNGTIYFGAGGQLYAVNSDGTEKWISNSMGGMIYGTPAIATDGTIYFGNAISKFFALNSNGIEKWNYTTGSQIKSAPAIASDGTIYFGCHDGKLYALNPNGTKKWDYATGTNIQASPSISSDGTIYICSRNGKMYAIYPNGTEKWNFSSGATIVGSSAISSDGIIYFGSDDHKMYAIYPNGTEKWNYTTGQTVKATPAISDDGTIYFGSYDQMFRTVNPDGTLKWSYNSGAIILSTAIIDANGVVYFTSGNNKIYALNPDGTLKWIKNIAICDHYSTNSLSIASDGTLYYGSNEAHLHAFESPIPTITLEISSQQNSNPLSTYINDIDSTGGFTDNNGYITLTPIIASSYPLTIEANLYEGIKLTFISNSTINSIPLTLTGLNPSQNYALYESGFLQYEFRSTSPNYFYDITTHDEISSFELVKLSSGGGGNRNEDIIDDTDDDIAIIIIFKKELPIELTKLILEEPIKTITTLIKNPVNWLIFLGAYIGILIGMLLLKEINYANILLYGTLTWVLSLLLLIIGLNLSLNYIFTSTSNILSFLTYIIYGLIMSIYLLIKGE